MAKIFTTVLKILIVLILLAGVAIGAYYLSNYLGWDWRWGVPLVVGGVVALVVTIVFIRNVLYRRREEGFVKRVIEQDESSLAGGPVFERRNLQDIESRFKDAVSTLRHSHLKRFHDPLYALPWYLLMGAPGSGKSMAMRNSRLPSSFPELGHPSGDEVTRNCDWWFFNDGIFIDTAGRYAVHAEQGKDKEEWKKFLSQLERYRQKEPINGLIITVPADQLGKENSDAMSQYGRSIHLRIDQLMRVLGAKFPIYILVTKTDKIYGMNEFASLLPWKAFRQSMGHINRKITQDTISFMDEALATVSERLKDLRLMILNNNPKVAPGLLVFPDEIKNLRPGLAAFINGAFQENPYQEPPILRGIFFSSASQNGAPVSKTMPALGIETAMAGVSPGTNRGIFLQDFFGKVLPDDRYLWSPIKEFLKWRTKTRVVGLLMIFAVAIFLYSLLTASWFKNYTAIDSFQRKFVKPPTMGSDISDNITDLNSFGKEIVTLESLNRNWYLPTRMGLHQSEIEEVKLKAYYVKSFQNALQSKIDEELKNRVARFDRNTPDAVIAQYVEHVTKRINIIKARLNGAPIEKQMQMPQPTTAVLLLIDKNLLPTVAVHFSKLYIYNLNWKKDVYEIGREKQNLEAMLVQLIELKSDNMEWLPVWAGMDEKLSSITLSQFWQDKIDDSAQTGILIEPAYTTAGKALIDDFIVQIDNALDDKTVIESRKPVFDKWYGMQYIRAWQNFGEQMLAEEQRRREQNEDTFRPRSRWQEVALRMTSFSNPYFDFLDKMAEELDFLKSKDYAPGWLKLAIDFKPMKTQVLSEGFVEQGISLAQTVGQGAREALSEPTNKPKKAVDNQLQAVEELKAYKQALEGTSPVLRSKDHAYQMASQLFKGYSEVAQSSSPFDTGYTAAKRMQALIGKNPNSEALFWDLLSGPLDSLLYYTTRETACSLQVAWEEQVLSDIQGVPDNRLQNELFGDQGVVWKFADGPADPFLKRNEKGYSPRSAYKQSIPFRDDFFVFLREGAIGRHSFKDEYEVTLKSLPTDVNEGAKARAEAVVLEMLCSGGVQRFENYNYPVTQTFKWSSEKCGGIKMDIVFRDFTLSKSYPNYTGFPYFLIDFRDGTKVFTPEDFPDYKARLEKAGINRILVRFEIAGQEPVIELIERTPLTAPYKIVYCWN